MKLKQKRKIKWLQQKDSKAKQYFSDNARFADIFNYLLYDGQEVIQPSSLQEMSPECFNHLKGGACKYRDILKAIVIRKNREDDQTFMLLGVEAQSTIDYTMVVRCMEYDLLRTWENIRRIQAKHRKAKDLKTRDEIFSKYSKTDRLPPVVTLVIYMNPTPWDGFKTYVDMLRPLSDVERRFVNDYKMHLIEPCQMKWEDFLKFKTDVRACFRWMKKLGNPEEAFDKMEEEDERLSNQIIGVLNESLGVNMEMDTVDRLAMANIGKRASVCIRRWIETGLQKGIQQGSMVSIKQFVHNKKNRGISDLEIKNDLITYFELSEEEASKILFEVCTNGNVKKLPIERM